MEDQIELWQNAWIKTLKVETTLFHLNETTRFDQIVKKKRQTRWLVVLSIIHLFLSFHLKRLFRGYFSSTFNSSPLHQIWQNLHENDSLTLDHTLVWFFLIDWHYTGCGDGPKRPTQATFNYQIWQFMMTTLSQRLISFPAESRVKIYSQKRQCPFLPIINKGELHALKRNKSEATV
jgi:hypothetical protein